MSLLDATTEFGARAERRLRAEHVIWLVTVRPDGSPQPSPVFFLWDGASFLIYSAPNTPKLRNIAHNPRVSLHLDSDPGGEDIVILGAEAFVAPDEPAADQVPEYVAKYRWAFERLQMTATDFARRNSVPIRASALAVRGH